MRKQLLVGLVALLAALVPLVTLAQDPDSDPDDEFVLRIDGSEFVEANQAIGVAIVINGDLQVEGRVADFMMVIDGDIAILNGAVVEADIIVIDGTLTLRDGSVVNGDIRTSGDSTFITEEGSQFNGTFRDDLFDRDATATAIWNFFLGYLVFWGATTVLLLVTAVIFAGIGGRQLVSSALFVTARPAGTVISALVFWILVSGAVGLLFITILGSPLATLLFITAVLVWVLGYVVAGTRVGALALGRTLCDEPGAHPYLMSVVGVLILQVINFFIGAGVLTLAMVAFFEGGTGWLGLLIGIPATLLAVFVWIIGTIGSGALIYRAFRAWTGSPYDERAATVEPA
jgi:hypothetical protein